MKKLFVLVLFFSVGVFAQELMTKVNLDRKAKNNLVTLFEELPQGVEVFVSSDSTYIIEAIYPDGKMVKRLSPSEFRSLIIREPEERVILEDAQLPYVIGQTVQGIGLYSWSFPLALGMQDSEDWESGVALGLMFPLLYSSGSYLFSKNMRVSGGAAYGSFLGGIEGAYHGGMFFESERAIFPVSLGENILDFALAQKMDLSSGMFQRKFNHCFYGYYHYAAAKTMFGWDGWNDDDEFLQVSTLLSLGEGYTSLFLSRNSEGLTLGDALFELRAGVIGGEALPLLLATYDLHSGENINSGVYAGLSLAGHGVGYWLGQKLSREHDLSGSGGVMLWLVPYLAHAATAGITFFSDNEGLQKSYPAIFLTTDVLLTLAYYKSMSKEPVEMGKADAVPDFNMAINPLGLICKDQNKSFENMPFFMFSYRF